MPGDSGEKQGYDGRWQWENMRSAPTEVYRSKIYAYIHICIYIYTCVVYVMCVYVVYVICVCCQSSFDNA